MKLRPAKSFLGCCSLMLGIEAACALNLIFQIIAIAICSSTRPINFAGLTVSPMLQVLTASWAFVGIPITIAGGVGALHRIGGNIWMLFYYQAASFSVGLLIPIWFLTSSSMCDLVVAPEVQNQGSAFICGFTDSFVFAWSLMLALVHAYIVYIIWSAAEDIRLFPNPELMQYEDALRGINLPDADQAPGPAPDMFSKAAVAMPQRNQAPLVDAGPGAVSMALDAAANRAAQAPGGVPQSFFPAPGSGFRFESNVA